MKIDIENSMLATYAVFASEMAATRCYPSIGRGDEKEADQLAVDGMRQALNLFAIDGTIVIGEGERDEAPMLYIGEKVGTGSGPKVDIALDPLEGTTICASALPNSLSVIAIANAGGFLHAPDLYMEKIAIGANLPKEIIDLDNSVGQNLKNLADAKNCTITDLLAVVLDRPRHEELIAKIRETGARVQLIGDGDVAAVIATATPRGGVDIYLGTGGAPEGVLAAAALRTMDGQMMTRLIFANDTDRERGRKMGIVNFDRKYTVEDMASGDIIFSATGVTGGTLLKGIRYRNKYCYTHTLVMNSKDKTIRKIMTKHLV